MLSLRGPQIIPLKVCQKCRLRCYAFALSRILTLHKEDWGWGVDILGAHIVCSWAYRHDGRRPIRTWVCAVWQLDAVGNDDFVAGSVDALYVICNNAQTHTVFQDNFLSSHELFVLRIHYFFLFGDSTAHTVKQVKLNPHACHGVCSQIYRNIRQQRGNWSVMCHQRLISLTVSTIFQY